MKKIKAALYVYIKSLSSIEYYRSVLSEPILFSVKYFLAISVVASLFITVFISFKAVPAAKSAFEGFVQKTKELYPSDLIISVKDDSWALNQPEPYIIPFPKIEGAETSTTKTFKNLIVLDHNGTLEDLQKHDSMILVNSKNLLAIDARGTIQVSPLKELPEVTIDKNLISKGIDQIAEFGKFLPAVIIGIIFFGVSFYYIILRTLYLLIAATFIKLIGTATPIKPSFSAAFRIAIHTLSLPLTIEFVVIMLGLSIPLAFWFLATNLIFATIVLTKLKPTEAN